VRIEHRELERRCIRQGLLANREWPFAPNVIANDLKVARIRVH
jgi:hypothetical protein